MQLFAATIDDPDASGLARFRSVDEVIGRLSWLARRRNARERVGSRGREASFRW